MPDASPAFYDETDTNLLSNVIFTNVQAGSTSPDVEIHLWNSKGDSNADTMTNIRLTIANATDVAGDSYSNNTNENGQEIVDEKMVEIKSSGIVGPSAITDDAMTSYKAVGGDPNVDVNNYLVLGDIPADSGRVLFFRINVPGDAETQGSVAFRIRIGYV